MKKNLRLPLIIVFICSIAGAYYLGTLQTRTSADTLRGELDSLLAKQSEAAVVKRVSQQMEDIAYQQKAISDQQRERAEEQSAIALKMRYVAEQESHSAHLAEEKAKKAAADAENERANALRHQAIAEKQRDEANLARSIADTLTFITLGSRLGQMAIDQYESGHNELAARLAYTGWAFLDNFKGNTFQTVTFESLSNTSGSILTYTKTAKGRITDIDRCESGFVYVSDYGEIWRCTCIGAEPSQVFSDNQFDFRDVLYDGCAIFSLSFNAFICKSNLYSETAIFPLPEDSYLKLADAGGSKLFAIGKKSVTLLHKERCEVEKHLELEKNVSTAVGTENGILVFFEDGSVSKCNAKLDLSPVKPFGNGTVTTAFYEAGSGALYVGYGSGEIQMIPHSGTSSSFPGHSGKISSLSAYNGVIVSASFDKTIDIRTASSPSSVTMSYREWPMCLSLSDDKLVIAGFDGGTLRIFNVSPRDMAEKIRDKGNCSLSKDEWKIYVGQNVPYLKL